MCLHWAVEPGEPIALRSAPGPCKARGVVEVILRRCAPYIQNVVLFGRAASLRLDLLVALPDVFKLRLVELLHV